LVRPHFHSDFRRLTGRFLDRFQQVPGADLLGVFEQALAEIEEAIGLHRADNARAAPKCGFRVTSVHILSPGRRERNGSGPTAVERPEGMAVGKTPDKQIKQIEQIEQTQEALRESIAEATHLADKAQQLLQKHKKSIEGPSA